MSRSNERDHSECKDIADMQFRRWSMIQNLYSY